MWHDGWSAGDWLLTGLLMLLFWALVVGAVVWALRRRGGGPDGPGRAGGSGDAAREILDARFARGEIDEQEYRRRRDLLGAR